MALITCPECGIEISDCATNCPKCGYLLSKSDQKEEPKYDKRKILFAGIFILLIVAALLFSIQKKDIGEDASSAAISPIDGLSYEVYQAALLQLTEYSTKSYKNDLVEDVQSTLIGKYGSEMDSVAIGDLFDSLAQCPIYRQVVQEINSITDNMSGIDFVVEDLVRIYWGFILDEAFGVAIDNRSGGSVMYSIGCLISDIDTTTGMITMSGASADEDEYVENSSIIYNALKEGIETATTQEELEEFLPLKGMIDHLPLFS